jgi:acetate kinase
MRKTGMSAAEMDKALNKKCGLLGITSGRFTDGRDIEDAAAKGDKEAQLSIDMFSYRLKKYIGAYKAALGRVDAIVFTAGIGENSAYVRGRILEMGRWLGVEVDQQANGQRGLARISSDASRVAVWVIPTDEELMIARHTQRALDARTGEGDGYSSS